jgi:hypothetical protein
MDEPLQASGPSSSTSAAATQELDDLRRYVAERFDPSSLPTALRFPLPDEPFVACWREWADEASRRGGIFAVLRAHLPQLAFPIREGVSETDDYRAATRRGANPAGLETATGLSLRAPDALELEIHPSPAGRVPVLVTPVREDFVTLVRALAKRGEPAPIPDSQGAAMVGGFNNWARIGKLRRRWESLDARCRQTDTWQEELARIARSPELFRDRFILLWDGPYSGVPGDELGVDPERWRRLSLRIRRDHECVHYLTVRLFGRMRNHAFDELLADYSGMVAAIGRFRADWFLRFMGIESSGRIRPGGRLWIYRGDPPLADRALQGLGALLRGAAGNLERLDASWLGEDRSLEARSRALAALALLRLDELAGPAAEDLLAESLRTVAAG